VIPLTALLVALLLMLGELAVSRRHERELLARGAVIPPDPVYATMRWAYPASFVVMALEGAVRGPAPNAVAALGIVLFVLAKILKTWAIASLGVRWTYRVLILPGTPLVTAGPYRWMRHPNYVGVVGELIGFALLGDARLSGPLATACFSWLLWRRIEAEERALGLG
jgi:methyltransferase